jgi:hypothetical protein
MKKTLLSDSFLQGYERSTAVSRIMHGSADDGWAGADTLGDRKRRNTAGAVSVLHRIAVSDGVRVALVGELPAQLYQSGNSSAIISSTPSLASDRPQHSSGSKIIQTESELSEVSPRLCRGAEQGLTFATVEKMLKTKYELAKAKLRKWFTQVR